jgi:hypothetical protein
MNIFPRLSDDYTNRLQRIWNPNSEYIFLRALQSCAIFGWDIPYLQSLIGNISDVTSDTVGKFIREFIISLIFLHVRVGSFFMAYRNFSLFLVNKNFGVS